MAPQDPSLDERLDSSSDHTLPTNRSLSSMFKGWGKKAGSTMGDAYRFITETPARIILTAGTALSLFAGMGVSKIMDYKSTHRPIHFTPYSAQGESEDVMLDISRGLSDLNNRLGLLYVQLAGATKESVPDKASLKEIIEGEIGHAQGIIALINRAQDYMSPFVPQINVLHNAGEQLHSSFSHRSRDEYHTECHTETDEVCTGSGNNEVCTDETNVVCTDVYDYTDHYWTFSDAQANSVVRGQFLPALDSLKKHPLKTINYDQLRRKEVPNKDALGREITNGDEYLKQANEWIEKGLAAKQNDLARIDMVANNGYVREMLMDAQSPQGFTGLSTYPPSTHVRNYCSRCDEESAPRGYLTLKQIKGITERYKKPYDEMLVVFSAAPPHLESVITELGLVKDKLDGGKTVTAEDILRAADRSTEAYLTLVPGSVTTAPTSSERFWWPWGIGGGLFILSCIGAGITASREDYMPSYRRDFRRW